MPPSWSFPLGGGKPAKPLCVGNQWERRKKKTTFRKDCCLFGNDVCHYLRVFKYLKIHFEMNWYKRKSWVFFFGGGLDLKMLAPQCRSILPLLPSFLLINYHGLWNMKRWSLLMWFQLLIWQMWFLSPGMGQAIASVSHLWQSPTPFFSAPQPRQICGLPFIPHHHPRKALKTQDSLMV